MGNLSFSTVPVRNFRNGRLIARSKHLPNFHLYYKFGRLISFIGECLPCYHCQETLPCLWTNDGTGDNMPSNPPVRCVCFSTLPVSLRSWWVTGVTWPTSGGSPYQRPRLTRPTTGWPSSRCLPSATLTSWRVSQSSAGWRSTGTAWNGSGGPTKVGGSRQNIIKDFKFFNFQAQYSAGTDIQIHAEDKIKVD